MTICKLHISGICLSIITILTQTVLIQNVKSAKILVIVPMPGKSHYIVTEAISKALAAKGHEVDVYSHFPQKVPIERYNDYSLEGTIPVITGAMTVDQIKEWKKLLPVLDIMTNFCGTSLCEPIFNSTTMKDLRDSGKKYDLFITERFGTDCMLGFSHLFKVPSVVVVSSLLYTWTTDNLAIPDNPSYISNYHSEFSPKMTFHERLVNTVTMVISKIYAIYETKDKLMLQEGLEHICIFCSYQLNSLEPSNQLARNFFGSEMPHLDTLLRNISLQLINAHFSVNQARPLPPNAVEIGGAHIQDPKPLNDHYSKLLELETNQKGVIYFTLGSLVVTESLPDKTIQAMSNALSKLPYKVLWKAKRENFPQNVTFGKNIYFEWWMPQVDILCQPNVKLYISHGGNAGVEEAVYCGVPVLGIPLFGDQDVNIAQLVYKGVALKVELDEITEENVYEKVYKLLNEPKFQQSAKRLQHSFRDRPLKPIDTAVYWIEYVLTHQGAPELKSFATELYWFQYHLLDVILVLVGVPIFSVVLVYLVIISYCCGRKEISTKKDKKKIQ